MMLRYFELICTNIMMLRYLKMTCTKTRYMMLPYLLFLLGGGGGGKVRGVQ